MDFAGFSVDNNAISSIPKMIPGQNGLKHHHYSHNHYLQHRQGPYQHNNYPSYQPPHGAYYQGARNHSRASTREKHVQHQIQVPSNVYEETKLSLNKIRKAELLGKHVNLNFF
jgi:hypothetical protein